MPTQTIPATLTYQWYYAQSATYKSGSTTSNYTRRNRTWSNYASYNSRLKKALLPTQSYTDYQEQQECTVGTMIIPGGYQSFVVGSRSPILSLSDAHVEECLSQAISNAAQKVGDYTVDLGVVAGEMSKTAKMFVNAAKTLARAGSQVRKGQFSRAADTLGISLPGRVHRRRSFSQNWLEYRYGWRTLMMDVEGAVKQCANLCVSKPTIACAKSTIKAKWKTERTGYQGIFTATTPVVGTVVSKTDWNCGASITYRYVVESEIASTANSLGLVNLGTLVWELVPYSFVVDWFTNVGSVIQNMGSFTGKQCVDGTRCRYIGADCRNYDVGTMQPLSGPWALITPKTRSTSRSVSRAFQRESIKFLSVVPRLNIDLNLLRGFDAASLLMRFLH